MHPAGESRSDGDRLRDIYKTYTDVISVCIMEFEIMTNEFPTEILNEIRAIFGHLSKYHQSDDTKIKEKNLLGAEEHLNRARLDGYKFMSMATEDEYSAFDKKFENIDLSYVDNGDFIPQLTKTRGKAKELLKDARRYELQESSSTNAVYEKYELAYAAYKKVHDLIVDPSGKLENLRRRAAKKNRKAIVKSVFAVLGWIIGIIIAIVSLSR